MLEFLSYMEDTTDSFAAQARSQLIKEIHKKVAEIKGSEDIEAEYAAFLQTDRKTLNESI